MKQALCAWISLVLLWCGATQAARADFVSLPQAVKASTIAEIFVETNLIRLELEIGLNDLETFRNLLPDDLYSNMEPDGPSHEVRLNMFFQRDFLIRPDQDPPLQGRLLKLGPRQRAARDEITGQPLPASEENQEVVVAASLEYDLARRPQTLAVRPPLQEEGRGATAKVGFVAYHQGLMVNDFQYLAGEEKLDLDWEDPWYSKFANPDLKRQFDASLSCFLYIDPFEVRKEIIARPRDLQHWVDLGLAGKTVLTVADQPALKEKVAEFLAVMNPVTIDGRAIEPVLDRIHFIERNARQTRVVDPPHDLPLVSATLGVIYSYPLTGMPSHVFMEWELFSDRIPQIPASASDEAGSVPAILDEDNPVLEWKNFLRNPQQGKPAALAVPPEAPVLGIPAGTVLCWLAALGLGWTSWRASRHGSTHPLRWVALVLLLAGGGVLWPHARLEIRHPWAGPPPLTTEEARDVMAGLLRNVYRAFDYREEGRIYDVLARSVSGDLLTQTYLETRRALELENQGGARTKVKHVELLETSTTPLKGPPGFTARCVWNVTGTVGHWGHLHQRSNQYKASLKVQPVNGSWKLTGLELLSEQRL